MKIEPIIPFYGHQTPFMLDNARKKGLVKSRQIGGSFIGTAEAVLDAIQTGDDWNMISRSQRQAKKLLKKAAKHTVACNRYIRDALRMPLICNEDRDIGSEEIRLKNGASICALPCDPDTIVGDTCNWLCDEFGLFPRANEVFGVIKPSIMRGKKIRVMSSPRGRKHKFYELYRTYKELGTESGWSWHTITIADAFAHGYTPLDEHGQAMSLEEFERQETLDIGPEMYAQEYMCAFVDAVAMFIPLGVIQQCQNPNTRMQRTPEEIAAMRSELFMGVDIGRRRDLTVIWIIEKHGHSYHTVHVESYARTSYAIQQEAISSLLKTRRISRAIVDETGIGGKLVEDLKAEFPVVEGLTFTNANKREMAERLRVLMHNGDFEMPDNEDIEDDFESIERTVTDSGNVIIAAPRGPNGHGDYFWAACMATHAGATCESWEFVAA